MGKVRWMIFVTLLLAVSVIGATPVSSAGPGERGKAGAGRPTAPSVEAVYFVDYVGPPPPIVPPGRATYDDTSPLFKVFRSGSRWPSTPVTYIVDGTGGPSGAVSPVIAGFDAWDMATSASLFSGDRGAAAGTWGCAPLVSDATAVVGQGADGVNSVFWRDLTGTPLSGALAVTCTLLQSFPTYTDIVEFDIVFNSAYPWSITGASGAYDVQSVATHEAGHTVWLDDLYQPPASELTMYGYIGAGETKKQSLGTGDINGVQFLYGP